MQEALSEAFAEVMDDLRSEIAGERQERRKVEDRCRELLVGLARIETGLIKLEGIIAKLEVEQTRAGRGGVIDLPLAKSVN